jgi:hypothetical protein
MMATNAADSPIPGDSAAEPGTPTVGGGWPVIDGWAKASLSLQGPLLCLGHGRPERWLQ